MDTLTLADSRLAEQVVASETSHQFVLKSKTFDLESTLDGGQAFRWWRVDDSEEVVAYDGVIGGTALRISEIPETGGDVIVEMRSEDVLHDIKDVVADYLGLAADTSDLQDKFALDPCIGPAIAGFPGLRLLRQDPWECLVSFICSSTSNIPRIKLNVGSVARELGSRVGEGKADFEFPRPEVVAAAGEQYLRDLGLGFRAKYLVPAAEEVAAGRLDLQALRLATYEEAKAALVALNGVGEKIADCVMAFSLDKPEAFPVDRHIRRALERWYGLPEGMNNTQAAEFARSKFGNTGALAQQYMFHRERLAQRAKWGGRHLSVALPEDR